MESFNSGGTASRIDQAPHSSVFVQSVSYSQGIEFYLVYSTTSVDQVVRVLGRTGIRVNKEEAEIILGFLYLIANI